MPEQKIGVGIIGIYKALRELQEMDWIGDRMPRLVAVQSSGCAPIVRAWQEKQVESVFCNQLRLQTRGLHERRREAPLD